MCLDTFLRETGLDEIRPASETAHWFHEQLLAVLAGQPSALPIYRTVHERLHAAVPGESAIVLVADLTGLQAVRAEVVSERWSLRSIGRWDNLSALGAPDSREAYFDCIARSIKPHLSKPFRIGLCLPFPLETTDGATLARPPADSPLHAVLDGTDPAEEMLSALQRAGLLLNGTVCAVAASVAVLFSGSVLPGVTPGNAAALVTDGGGQIAYFEQSRPGRPLIAMTAALGYPPELTAVTALSPAREPLSCTNRTTLGGLALLHARAACDRECFTSGAARQLRSLKTLATPALCSWLGTHRPDPTIDEQAFHTICYQLVQHVGRRLAAAVAGVLRRVTRHAPDAVSFSLVHGTSFSNSRMLRENLHEELSSIDSRYGAHSWRLAQVENDMVIGTACAALHHMPVKAGKRTAKNAV